MVTRVKYRYSVPSTYRLRITGVSPYSYVQVIHLFLMQPMRLQRPPSPTAVSYPINKMHHLFGPSPYCQGVPSPAGFITQRPGGPQSAPQIRETNSRIISWTRAAHMMLLCYCGSCRDTQSFSLSFGPMASVWPFLGPSDPRMSP